VVSVYFKPTNFCNVGCDHCYLSCETKANKLIMSPTIVAKTARFIVNMRDDLNSALQNSQGVHIIYHGGEPLMAPLEWFNNASRMLKEYIPDCSQSIQTSLMPHRPDMFDWYRQNTNSSVGISFDWSSRKIDGSAEKYREKFISRVKECHENGINTNVGIVPSKPDIPFAKEIVDFFIENNLHNVRIERFNTFGFTSDIQPTNAEHSQFMIDMFDYIMERYNKGLSVIGVNYIAAAVAGLCDGMATDTYSGNCQTTEITVEPNGDLNICPNCVSYTDPVGTVFEGWKSFRSSMVRRNWIMKQQLFHFCEQCKTCDYIKWCKGNCPLTPHNVGGEGDDCAGFSKFINHVRKYMEQGQAQRSLLIKYFYEETVIGKNVAHRQRMMQNQTQNNQAQIGIQQGPVC